MGKMYVKKYGALCLSEILEKFGQNIRPARARIKVTQARPKPEKSLPDLPLIKTTKVPKIEP